MPSRLGGGARGQRSLEHRGEQWCRDRAHLGQLTAAGLLGGHRRQAQVEREQWRRSSRNNATGQRTAAIRIHIRPAAGSTARCDGALRAA